MKDNLYVFQWISDLGGADTRLKELLVLLKDIHNITCVPNDEFRLREKHNTDFLDKIGIKYCLMKDLPKKLTGFAYANCNFRIFSDFQKINFIKESGLKFIWSNDMMWHTPEELNAVKKNQIDVIAYTSPFHRSIMHKDVATQNKLQKTFILENYFDADTWPLVQRVRRNKTVFGKVSRDDPMKFGDNFPIFYEQVCEGLECEFSVLGWSDKLSEIYEWYKFDNRWRLYAANAMPTQEWLTDLDVFLYNCNFKFIENQSRTIIESQLSGAPVIAPYKWNFPNMIIDKECGFLWHNFEEAKEAAAVLCDYETRTFMGKKSSEYAKDVWCNKEKSISKWHNLLKLANQNVEVNL